jgi:hypothetical protein
MFLSTHGTEIDDDCESQRVIFSRQACHDHDGGGLKRPEIQRTVEVSVDYERNMQQIGLREMLHESNKSKW